MTTAITIKDSGGTDRQLACVDDGSGNLTTIHVEQTAQRQALLAALSPLATTALQTSTAASIISAIQTTSTATQPVSAASLPLPSGAASDLKLEAVRALLAGTLTFSAASLPLPATAATDASIKATASADDIVAITPSDTAILSPIPKALLCTVAGNLVVKGATSANPAVTIPVVAGQLVPLRARYVMAATTASVIGLI